VYDRYLIEAA
jgi:hypothetical protein